jgi:hypothetical protein
VHDDHLQEELDFKGLYYIIDVEDFFVQYCTCLCWYMVLWIFCGYDFRGCKVIQLRGRYVMSEGTVPYIGCEAEWGWFCIMACKVKYTNKECADMHYTTGEAGTNSTGAEPYDDEWYLSRPTLLPMEMFQRYVTHKPRHSTVPVSTS